MSFVKKLNFIFITFFWCTKVWAEQPTPKICGTEIKSVLEKITTSPANSIPWVRAEVTSDGQTWRASNGKFGNWLELLIRKKGTPSIYDISSEQTFKFEFDSHCSITKSKELTLTPAFRSNFGKSAKISDSDLVKIMQKNLNGMIYVWSPRMQYSVEQYGLFKKAAKKNNLHFLALVDPKINFENLMNIASQDIIPSKVKQLDSVELALRDATAHFPTTYLYINGKLSNKFLVGAYNEVVLQREIDWAKK